MNENIKPAAANKNLPFFLLLILLGWSALDFGGRYLHVQTIAQSLTGGLLILSILARWRQFSLLKDYPFSWPSVLFIFLLALSFVFSVNRLASLEEVFRYLMYLSLPLILWLSLSSEQGQKLSACLVGIGVMICGLGWLNLENTSLTSTFYRTNDLAGYLLLLTPFTVHLVLQENRFKHRLFYFLASIVFVLSLLNTGSRSAWLSCVLALGLLLWFHRQRLHPRIILGLLMGIGILGGGMVWSKWAVLWPRVESILTLSIFQENSAAWRMDLWKVAWKIFLDHPVWGSGPNTYATIFPSYQIQPGYFSINPHNYYLQLLAEMGFLGLGAFGILMAVIGWRLWQNPNALTPGILAGLLASLTHIGFDIEWSVTAIPILFFVFVGLGITDSDKPVTPTANHLLPSILCFLAACLILIPNLNYFSAKAFGQSQLYLSQKSLPEAKQAIQQAIFLAPWPSSSHYLHLSRIQFQEENWPEAMMAVLKAIALTPYKAEPYYQAAELVLNQNQVDTAIELLKKRIELAPYVHPRIYGDLGQIYWERKKNLNQALFWYKQGMAIFPVQSLGRYEKYTPGDRYELFTLYRAAEDISRELKQIAQAENYAQQAQAIFHAAPPDLYIHSDKLATPVQAILSYWKNPQAQGLHSESQIPPPPVKIEAELSALKFLVASRELYQAKIKYTLPIRAQGTLDWKPMTMTDFLVPERGEWRILARIVHDATSEP